LVGIVDGQNNAAVYRFTSAGGNVGIFLVTPGSATAKNQHVEIRGVGFITPATSKRLMG
jgi:hypothetical protein